jgi:ornithine cyclodeaminase/alanine dehydrogenase-like protein (mu-crystallin family)
MRILSANDVRAAITMHEAIQAVREGFIALSTQRARVPLRTVLSTHSGTNLYMPAYLEGAPFSAVKIVSVYPDNARYGLPMVQASVLVLDAETGQTCALLDGTFLTALRTGAGSGLATDLLARTDAAVLGVIGAGTQARTQIDAICAVRPIQEIRIYSRRGAQALANSLESRYPGLTIRATASAGDALRGADVLVAATTSSTPVIDAEDVSPGAHINGIGSYTPTMQEVAAEIVTRARIVVDSREGCLAEAGDLLIPIRAGVLNEGSIYAEIGEIAAGLKPGRANAEEITFYKSVGNAVQDAAVAARVVEVAEAQNLGTVVSV